MDIHVSYLLLNSAAELTVEWTNSIKSFNSFSGIGIGPSERGVGSCGINKRQIVFLRSIFLNGSIIEITEPV